MPQYKIGHKLYDIVPHQIIRKISLYSAYPACECNILSVYYIDRVQEQKSENMGPSPYFCGFLVPFLFLWFSGGGSAFFAAVLHARRQDSGPLLGPSSRVQAGSIFTWRRRSPFLNSWQPATAANRHRLGVRRKKRFDYRQEVMLYIICIICIYMYI